MNDLNKLHNVPLQLSANVTRSISASGDSQAVRLSLTLVGVLVSQENDARPEGAGFNEL